MNMTPRKFKAQLDVHQDVQSRMYGNSSSNSSRDASNQGYIDQIPGW